MQNKVLVKTEYSVIAGECYFMKKKQAGALTLDGDKFSFEVNQNQIQFFSRGKIVAQSEIEDFEKLDDLEFTALAFGLVREMVNHKAPSMTAD